MRNPWLTEPTELMAINVIDCRTAEPLNNLKSMKVSYMKNFGLYGDLKPQPSALLADVEANIFHIWNLHIFVPLVLNHISWITVNPQVPLFSMYLLFQLTLLYINASEIFIKSFAVITKIIIINQWFILSSQISKKNLTQAVKCI